MIYCILLNVIVIVFSLSFPSKTSFSLDNSVIFKTLFSSPFICMFICFPSSEIFQLPFFVCPAIIPECEKFCYRSHQCSLFRIVYNFRISFLIKESLYKFMVAWSWWSYQPLHRLLVHPDLADQEQDHWDRIRPIQIFPRRKLRSVPNPQQKLGTILYLNFQTNT